MLDPTVYGTPSGNYDGSSQDWFSDAVTAATYYRGRPGDQTVTISVTGFEGIIKIEASLDTLPDTATWFEIYNYVAATPLTDYTISNIRGNFVWMRARIEEFSSGTINEITVTY